MLYRMHYTRRHRVKLLVIALVLLLAATTLGCSNFGYYTQSIAGGYEVLSKREPITDVLQDPSVSPDIKHKLQVVLEIRDFASREMQLPDNNSYRTYVDLKRPYVVWNVFAAPEFSMEMKEWCFLFVGCVRYRGYFHEEAAEQYASKLKEEALDVYVAGIAAYSTIGWFDDPVLNTIVNRDEIRLAGLIFHELSHQEVFIKGDTAFNEGFSVTVELEGVKRWLAYKGSPDLMEKYQQRKAHHKQFVALVNATRDRLEQLYASDMDAEMKRKEKAAIIEGMRQQYEQLKAKWDGFTGYDRWFAKPINNAQIAAVTTYRDYVPAFQALLAQNNFNMRAFYKAVEELGDLPKEERQKAIQALLQTTPAS
ncbi:aminopeptidase [Kaarinaea lacus]